MDGPHAGGMEFLHIRSSEYVQGYNDALHSTVNSVHLHLGTAGVFDGLPVQEQLSGVTPGKS